MPATSRMGRVAALPQLFAVLLAVLLTVGAFSAPAEAADRQQKIKHGMTVAVKQKGDPYRYGAAGPDAFDCSGLVYYSFRKAGFRVPRTSDSQASQFRNIARSNMKRGDFVFFHRGGDVYHVGIFAGWKDGSRFIVHAPYGNGRVKRERIWTNSWFPATLRKRG